MAALAIRESEPHPGVVPYHDIFAVRGAQRTTARIPTRARGSHLLPVCGVMSTLHGKRFPLPTICSALAASSPPCPVCTRFAGRHFPPVCAVRPTLPDARFPPLPIPFQLHTSILNFSAYKG